MKKLMLLLCLVLIGCGGGQMGAPTPTPTDPPSPVKGVFTSIRISSSSQYLLPFVRI